MKYLLSLVFTCFMLANAQAHENDKPTPRGAGLKVLVYSNTGYYRHPDIPAINRWLVVLGHENGFEVDTTENGMDLQPGALEKYDIFLLNNANELDKVLTEEQRKWVEDWYAKGNKGVVALHAALVHQLNWPWLNRLGGCDFDSDSLIVKARVTIDPKAKDHPTVKGQPEEFWYEASWTNHDRSVTGLPGFQVLMRVDESTYDPVQPYFKELNGKPMGKDHPIAWTHEPKEGGRFFYTEFGHNLGSLDTPFGRQHVLEGILWAANKSVPKAAKHDSKDHATKSVQTLLKRGKETLFPIGWYDLPANDADLREMAESGINLICCRDRSSLDRAERAGMLGWMPLSVQQGATPELRQQISSVVDHPALAVWEGPDEVIWTFTAYSGLEKTAGFKREVWYEQRPNALKYAESQAAVILPKMREGIELIRLLDSKRRPFWMNEAVDSDLRYVRGYTNVVDAVGCDYYPVRKGEIDLRTIGKSVDRWKAVGAGKPVWMVLQAFSWHPMVPERGRRYPHFHESRFMTYTSIAHGAEAVLYWGSFNIDDPAFRKSMYALTSELAALQPFLIEQPLPGIHANVILDLNEPPSVGVRTVARRAGEEVVVILVNEDGHRHLGVDVEGLSALNGRKLFELYGADEVTVDQGRIAVRMKPFEVKLYCTSRQFESSRRVGRDYLSPAESK